MCDDSQLTFFDEALFATVTDAEVWHSLSGKQAAGEKDHGDLDGIWQQPVLTVPPHGDNDQCDQQRARY